LETCCIKPGSGALEEAVERLETYERFHPDHFDRRKVNRRLKQCAQGDEEWRGYVPAEVGERTG
jgi:hypothetical protein